MDVLSNPVTDTWPPGWHPDPLGRHEQRYWDGAEWTAHITDDGAPGTDPLPSNDEAKPEQSTGHMNKPSKTGAFLKSGLIGLAKASTNTFAGITLKDGQIKSKQGDGPVKGAHATVETSGEIEKRITATRIMTTGFLALAFKKKKDKRELYLTVEGPGYAIVVDVDPKKQLEARQFAARINAAATAPPTS